MRNRDLEERDSVESGLEAAKTGKYEKAYNIWKPLADEGNPFAQLNIGIMYLSGLYVDQNIDKGHEWLEMASKSGVAEIVEAINLVAELDNIKAQRYMLAIGSAT